MSAARPRFPLAYRVAMGLSVVELLLVFSRQISFRVGHEGWKLYTSDAVLQSPTIDLHALTALLWIGVFLAQFELGRRIDRGGGVRVAHRRLGRGIAFVLVPAMSLLSFAALALNPLGLSNYTVATVSMMWALSTVYFALGVRAIRRGRAQAHADLMYMAFITLAAVATYRIVLVLAFLATGMFMPTLPIVVSWLLTLAKIGGPLALHRRLGANRLALALFVACVAGFVVWGLARGLFLAIPPPVLAS